MKTRLFVVLIVLSFCASEVFAYKKIKCFVLQPPELMMSGIKRLAILDFEGNGNYGRFLADQMIQQLLQDSRGISNISGGIFGGSREGRTFLSGATTKVFDLVERSAIENVLREQNLSMTGIVDASQAAAVGKVLGVDAIVTGTYAIHTEDSPSTETWQYTQNKQKYSKQVSCLTRKTSVNAALRLLSVSTAQILGNLSKQYSHEEKKCDTEINKLISVDAQVNMMLQKISGDFVSYFNPYFVKTEIELQKIKVKDFEKMAEDAAKAADSNEIDKAFLYYYSIYQQDSYNPQLLFNLGALHEIVGNFDDALKMYEGATQLEANDDYRKAAARTQKSATMARGLAQIGVMLNKHEFVMSQQAIANATAAKVTVKGKREDRIIIHERADDISPAIARVPGGIELKVISEQANWLQIELPDGKQGYLQINLTDKR